MFSGMHGTLVVGSIVLAAGLAVVLGNTGKRVGALEDDAHAVSVLARLHQDLSAERRALGSRADSVTTLEANAQHLIDWFDELESSSSLRLIQELGGLVRFGPRSPTRLGYDALAMSGDLAQIRDGRVRGLLAEYFNTADELRAEERRLTQALADGLDRALPRGVWYEIWHIEDAKPQPVDYRAAMATLDDAGMDRQLRTTLRALRSYRAGLNAQIERATQLIEMLEAGRAAL